VSATICFQSNNYAASEESRFRFRPGGLASVPAILAIAFVLIQLTPTASTNRKNVVNERKPLSVAYHPTGLLFMPLIPLAIAVIDFFFLGGTLWGGSLRPYGLAALWVVPWHIFQLIFDYRHTDRWYTAFTTPPYYLRNRREFLALRWPAIVALVPAFFLGIIPVACVWSACMLFYYPWQRALYLRSQREFGHTAKAVG